MLLQISTTHKPATDLGYLLHKNPGRLHTSAMTFGQAHVFYPEVTAERCTAALLVEVDPVKLVRGGLGFDQYVNDRPYVASSFLSSAIREMFSTAMGGRSKERQELAGSPIPLEVSIPVIASRGGEALLRRLLEPLGYAVQARRLPLDERFPSWGESPYFELLLAGTVRVQDLLNHLYVLIPVLDEEKHYWVNRDEIEKLLRKGGEWLRAHPHRMEIARRYLARQPQLTREALARLAEGGPDPDAAEAEHAEQEEKVERPLSLHDIRLRDILEVLRERGARRVLDLGCGEGRLLTLLLKERQFTDIVGMDVSYSVLLKAQRRLRVDRLPPMQAARLTLFQSSLVYRDRRLEGYDAAVLAEVIEHLDAPRLGALERNVFEFARPKIVVITTPNREYNALFETLPEGQMRHKDHRFEWTRAEFTRWCGEVGRKHGYKWHIHPIGPEHEELGAPSQMGVFECDP
ncbi:MAG TPA: 3' terminal RNA ribose 2'-O-methyltransferase Hen1 [Fimbriimonadaceae bacterium]|nr:3' terminal RNA ribose 2'-O-methyltransferase Hen1 [Fimbriimonadaceae bacterium]